LELGWARATGLMCTAEVGDPTYSTLIPMDRDVVLLMDRV
jgi:hypothetical protein